MRKLAEAVKHEAGLRQTELAPHLAPGSAFQIGADVTNLRDDGDLRLAIRELRARLCHCPVVVCDQEVGSTCQQPGAPVLEAIDDSCGEQLLDRPHDPVAKEPGRGQAGCGKGELRAREDVCF